MLQFTTSELLTITGVSSPVFKQWINRKHVALTSGDRPGTGNHRRHALRDVMHVAIVAELTRLGVPPARAKMVWEWTVAPVMAANRWPIVLISVRPDGSDADVRVTYNEKDFGLDAPDAPASFVVLRTGTLADRLAKRIEQVKGAVS